MNLRFVEAFHWVVALKSVSRAAEKLFISQSAMSSRIAALEEELGVLLLDRREKQIRLTAAGVRFHDYAGRLLQLQREAKAEMGGGGVRPVSLRVGAIESVLHSWLIDWIQHMRGKHPELELELTVETSPVLADQVKRGTLDMVLTAMPAAAEGLRHLALPPMEMVFVGHADLLRRRRRYTLAEIAALDLLTFQRGSQPHVALVDLLRDAGHEPRRVHNVSSISAMVQLVESGLGVATLPLAAVQRLSQRLALGPLRCEATLPPLPVHLIWRDDPTSMLPGELVSEVLAFLGAPPLLPARRRGSRAARPGAVLESKKSVST